MTEVVFTEAAAKIVKSEVTAFKSDRKRHVTYVNEMNVTLDTVADHVAAFRDAYRAANPKATGDEVKAFATKIRNGLNRVLGKTSAPAGETDWLLKVVNAVDAAEEHGISLDEILAAIKAA